MLLTERLYYRQVAQSAPDPSRLTKVRKTMAMIKLVISERARATALVAEEAEHNARLSNVKSALEAAFSQEGSATSDPQQLEMVALEASDTAAKLPVPANIAAAAKRKGRKVAELTEAEAEKLKAAEQKRIDLAGVSKGIGSKALGAGQRRRRPRMRRHKRGTKGPRICSSAHRT